MAIYIRKANINHHTQLPLFPRELTNFDEQQCTPEKNIQYFEKQKKAIQRNLKLMQINKKVSLLYTMN